MPPLYYTKHARDQMLERQISEADVETALHRQRGNPDLGNNGLLKVFGYTQSGRILKVVVTPDLKEIITAAWPDE